MLEGEVTSTSLLDVCHLFSSFCNPLRGHLPTPFKCTFSLLIFDSLSIHSIGTAVLLAWYFIYITVEFFFLNVGSICLTSLLSFTVPFSASTSSCNESSWSPSEHSFKFLKKEEYLVMLCFRDSLVAVIIDPFFPRLNKVLGHRVAAFFLAYCFSQALYIRQ